MPTKNSKTYLYDASGRLLGVLPVTGIKKVPIKKVKKRLAKKINKVYYAGRRLIG
jgi:hypothetical protein